MNHEVIGFLAACLTTGSFIPQVWKIWVTRSTRDLSWGTTALFTVGVALWLVYGISIAAPSIIVANAITLTLWIAIALMKWRFETIASRE